MNKHNLRIILLCLSSATIVGCQTAVNKAPQISQNTYYGKWTGNHPTSLEILSENPIVARYCYRKECNNHKPSGTLEELVFEFSPGGQFPGADMTMKLVDESYRGIYQRKGSSEIYTAVLSKPATATN